MNTQVTIKRSRLNNEAVNYQYGNIYSAEKYNY